MEDKDLKQKIAHTINCNEATEHISSNQMSNNPLSPSQVLQNSGRNEFFYPI